MTIPIDRSPMLHGSKLCFNSVVDSDLEIAPEDELLYTSESITLNHSCAIG